MKGCLSLLILSTLVLSAGASLEVRAGSGVQHAAHKKMVARNFGSPAQKQPRSKRRRATKNCKAKTTTTAQPAGTPAPAVPVNAVQDNSGNDSSNNSGDSGAQSSSSTTSKAPKATHHTTTPNTDNAATMDSGYDLSGTLTGDLTYYGIGLGACGVTNGGNDLIAAVSHQLFDGYPGYDGANPNNNPICGRSASVNWGGKNVVVKLMDRCGGCEIFGSLDLSPAAFKVFDYDQALGRLHNMTWTFV